VTDILHIGKEANDIENEPLETGRVQVFRNEEKERLRIIEMRQCDAERLGIARVTRWRMKKGKIQ
jgi:histidyl-tRNA synthetase